MIYSFRHVTKRMFFRTMVFPKHLRLYVQFNFRFCNRWWRPLPGVPLNVGLLQQTFFELWNIRSLCHACQWELACQTTGVLLFGREMAAPDFLSSKSRLKSGSDHMGVPHSQPFPDWIATPPRTTKRIQIARSKIQNFWKKFIQPKRHIYFDSYP